MEKEVKKTCVSGERFEDLNADMMQKIQGQGSIVGNDQLVTIPIERVTLTIKETIVMTNSGVER